MSRRFIGSSAVVVAVVLGWAANAGAQGVPFTAEKLQLGGGVQYGLYLGDDLSGANPYGIGPGIAFGYTLDFGLFFGAEFNYFIGGSGDTGEGSEVSANIMQYGAEFGYDWALKPDLVIRPKLGIGLASFSAEYSGADNYSTDSSGFAFPIGVQAKYSLGAMYLDGQLRYAYASVTHADSNATRDASAIFLGVGAGAAF